MKTVILIVLSIWFWLVSRIKKPQWDDSRYVFLNKPFVISPVMCNEGLIYYALQKWNEYSGGRLLLKNAIIN